MRRYLLLVMGLCVITAVAAEAPQAWTPRSPERLAEMRRDPVCVEFAPRQLAELIARGEVRKGMRESDVLAALGEPERKDGPWWLYPDREENGYIYKRQLVMRKGCLWDPGAPYLHEWPRSE